MRRVITWTGRTFVAVLGVIAVAVIGGYIWLRTSLPAIEGRVVVAGIADRVEIVRDANAVPHIFARSPDDAYFALGYVHAQDRLWQMERSRRMGAGRLAEIAGSLGVPWDRFARTLGFYRLAEADVASLSPEARRAIDAYAAGVNAYIDGHEGAWPPEFYLGGARPEPWKPADSVVWGRLMALLLSTNWQSELLRARVIQRVGAERMRDLWPDYPTDGPITNGAGKQLGKLYQALPLGALADSLPSEAIGVGASNEWAVAGTRTATGKPILANDPHLPFSAPIMWYLARIEAPGMTLAGVTVPGTPLLLLGHNGRIAWGLTTTYADTTDVFVERLDPADSGRYLTPDGSRPFTTRTEVIRVRFGEPRTFTVRETRHGPVLDDVIGERSPELIETDRVLALAAPWLAPGDRTPDAILGVNRARNWNDFTAALKLYDAPVQNIVYADVDGNIGIYTPGRIPIRRNGNGFLPSPGWTGEHDWSGFIPFEQLPHAFNPASGVIINANNRLAGDDYPHFLSIEWGDSFRARRIADVLKAEQPHTLDRAATLQGDAISYVARGLLPHMLAAPLPAPRERRAAAMLEAWDGAMDRRRPEPLIFAAWFRELNRLLYADELGPLFGSYWGLRPEVVVDMLSKRKAWCDDVGTEIVETCEQRIAAALTEALDRLAERHGGDMDGWRWGEAHFADMRHQTLRFIPVLKDLTAIRIAADGGNFTVNRAGTEIRDDDAPFADRHGAGYRAVYDLGNLDNSRFIIATGQSGNPLSPRYDDLIERWRDIGSVRLAGRRDEVADGAAGVLTLAPAGAR